MSDKRKYRAMMVSRSISANLAPDTEAAQLAIALTEMRAELASTGAAEGFERYPDNETNGRIQVSLVVEGSVPVNTTPFFKDKVTGEPCPRRDALMCTHTNPDHLHVAIGLTDV